MTKATKSKAGTGGGSDKGGEIVSAVALARHLDCSRSYIDKLVEAGAINRRCGGGFDLDAARIGYIRFLRRERQQSPKPAAEAKYTAARTKLLEIRAAEKLGEFMSRAGFEEAIDDVVGIFLTGLGSMPARIGRDDLPLRRRVEAEVFEVRRSVSRACAEKLVRKQAEWAREDDPID